jgi:hypothetical protein
MGFETPRLCGALSIASVIERHSATLIQLALQDDSLGAVDASSAAAGILDRLGSQHHRVRELRGRGGGPMDWNSSSAENIWFCLIAFVALAIVPMMIIWWDIARLENTRRRKAGIPTGDSRWHFLRYGPTAPLISAVILMCGLQVFIFRPEEGGLSPTVAVSLAFMTVPALIAFMVSMVLWSYSNAPPRSKSLS